jgi:sarcosine oxidase subunit beta
MLDTQLLHRQQPRRYTGNLIDHYDVAVVGAGLVGCAAAFELARRGRRVMLFDQSELNRGASGRNAGSLHFQLEQRFLDDVMTDPELLSKLIPVNLQAIEDWKGLPARLQHDIELHMEGGLMVAETQPQLERLVRKQEVETAGGLATRIIEGRELRDYAPYLSPSIKWAACCAEEGHANPRLVTPAYAHAARALGCRFELNAEVRSITPRAAGWRVSAQPLTPRSTRQLLAAIEIDVETVLIATGAWSGQLLDLLGATLPVQALGLSVNVTDRAQPLIKHLVQHVAGRLSVKQLESGNILIGGGWPATLPLGSTLGLNPDTRLQESSILGSSAAALRTIPALRSLCVIRSWTGITSVSPDHLPVLGALDSLPGMFVAAGGSAFTLGPTYARLISELICTGAASLPLDLYRPSRFTRLN